VVLDPGALAPAVGLDVGTDVVGVELEADVAVELAIDEVARVAVILSVHQLIPTVLERSGGAASGGVIDAVGDIFVRARKQ